MFALTLTHIAWNWFEPNINNLLDMPTLKEVFIKMSNSWDRHSKNSQHTGKNKFDHNKHDVEYFPYDFSVLGKLTAMSDV